MTRQVVLDTETTGIDIASGNRIIEIGCIEVINRKLTGHHYHQYINPQHPVEEGAYKVHGLSDAFLSSKPLFSEIADEFLSFIDGAELIIHNAPFDVGFLNHELGLLKRKGLKISTICQVTDTLVMAKEKHPGQRNSLDALCKRYEIDNSSRDLHGALLDAELLADVYLSMTGGQTGLLLSIDDTPKTTINRNTAKQNGKRSLKTQYANTQELIAHKDYLTFLEKTSDSGHLF